MGYWFHFASFSVYLLFPTSATSKLLLLSEILAQELDLNDHCFLLNDCTFSVIRLHSCLASVLNSMEFDGGTFSLERSAYL